MQVKYRIYERLVRNKKLFTCINIQMYFIEFRIKDFKKRFEHILSKTHEYKY